MLSPSSAHRWLHCPASVPLTRTCKDDASPFADEGTRRSYFRRWWSAAKATTTPTTAIGP
ncbi:DUF2800 domain-containing protein [Xylella fastidiosa]